MAPASDIGLSLICAEDLGMGFFNNRLEARSGLHFWIVGRQRTFIRTNKNIERCN